MSKEGKHHYIPVFYLKQWAGADGRICEFSKPYDRVKARRVFPHATAYVHGLNRIPGLPPHEADFLESYFFKLSDDLAAKALQILLSGARTLKFSPKVKSGWSRFITSLMMRNPEMVERSMLAAKALYEQSRADLQASYARHRNPTDPPTYEEYTALHPPIRPVVGEQSCCRGLSTIPISAIASTTCVGRFSRLGARSSRF
jgi:hypothetical protein